MSDIEEQVLDLCSTYLAGSWTDKSNINVRKIDNGFGNRNFRCSLKRIDETLECPSELVVKIYGSSLIGNGTHKKINGEAAESVIIDILHNLGMAPKLLGVFPGGRIEEYIPSTTCSFEDFLNPEINGLIARKLARIHSLQMPISKKPAKVSKTINMLQNVLAEENRKLEDAKFDVLKELKWYEDVIKRISGKPVFTHGDVNSNNILVIRDAEGVKIKDVMLIDYEVCSYYYRSADIANFFILRHLQAVRVDDKLKLVFAPEKFKESTQEFEDQFLKEYLEESKLLGRHETDFDDTLEHLAMEVDFSRLHVHAFLLGFFENFSKSIDPNCQEYEKLCDYKNTKKSIINKYKDQLDFSPL